MFRGDKHLYIAKLFTFPFRKTLLPIHTFSLFTTSTKLLCNLGTTVLSRFSVVQRSFSPSSVLRTLTEVVCMDCLKIAFIEADPQFDPLSLPTFPTPLSFPPPSPLLTLPSLQPLPLPLRLAVVPTSANRRSSIGQRVCLPSRYHF